MIGKLGQAANTILIKISGDSTEFKKNMTLGSNINLKSLTSLIKPNIALVASTLGVMAVTAGFMASMSAAEYQSIARAYTNLVQTQGKNADTYLNRLKTASHNTMSKAELMKAANRAMLMDIKIDDIITMLEGSMVIAQATGQDRTMMFESMVMGTARESKMLLDNLGILIDVDKATENYKIKMGIVGRELTDSEQKAAFIDAAMGSLADKTGLLGGYQENTQTKMAQLNAMFADLTVEIGEDLLPITIEMLNFINWLAVDAKGIQAGVLSAKIIIGQFINLWNNIKVVIDGLLYVGGIIGNIVGLVSDTKLDDLKEKLKGSIDTQMKQVDNVSRDFNSLMGLAGKTSGADITSDFDRSSFPRKPQPTGYSDGVTFAKSVQSQLAAQQRAAEQAAAKAQLDNVSSGGSSNNSNRSGIVSSSGGGATGGGGTWSKGYGGVYKFTPNKS